MPLWTPSTTSAQPTFPTAPTLNQFQMQINSAAGSLTIGAGTSYSIQSIKGLAGSPKYRSGDQPRPRGTGEFMGWDFAGGRDVSIKLFVTTAYGGSSIQSLLATLAAAMVPSANTEYPLWFNMPGIGTLALVCRPRMNDYLWDQLWAGSGVAKEVTLEFHATDPRCYAADSPTTINFPSGSGSIVFPFTDPLTFSGTTATGTLTNNGNFPSDCLIEFYAGGTGGTLSDPFIADTTSEQALAFATAVGGQGDLSGAGDIAWLDTAAKTVIYWPAGATTGQLQRGWLEAGSAWFSAAVGSNTFKIGSSSQPTGFVPGTQCVIHAPSAYML